MKWRILAITILVVAVVTASCYAKADNNAKPDGGNPIPTQTAPTKSSYSDIKPEEAKRRLENEKGIILLDVRTQEEYLESHIHDSMLIPVDEIEKEAPSKLADKNAVIFVYCRSGRRSAIASQTLADMGYINVYNLGGIIDWPYEIISGK